MQESTPIIQSNPLEPNVINAYKQIRNDILNNITSEGELDLTNSTPEQLDAEIFHRYQLRVLYHALESIREYKKSVSSNNMFQEDKDIIIAISKYSQAQLSRFSPSACY